MTRWTVVLIAAVVALPVTDAQAQRRRKTAAAATVRVRPFAPIPQSLVEEIVTESKRSRPFLLIDKPLSEGKDEPYPLPLASHWSRGQFPVNKQGKASFPGLTPLIQYQHYLSKGKHVIPWVGTPTHDTLGSSVHDVLRTENGELQMIQLCAQSGMPISLISTDLERLLLPIHASKPPKPHIANPFLQFHRNRYMLSPLQKGGGEDPLAFIQVGQRWTKDVRDDGKRSQLRWIQEYYPNPSQVLFVSNNEVPRMRFKDMEDVYGHDWFKGTDEAKRKEMSRLWELYYKAMLDAHRESLTRGGQFPQWADRDITRYVGYNAFGDPSWLRNTTFTKSDEALHCADHMAPWAKMWDGVSLQAWTRESLRKVDAPQAIMMNYAFQHDDAVRLARAQGNKYWFELTVRNENCEPVDQWQATTAFALWTLRPNCIRPWARHNLFPDEPAETGEHSVSVQHQFDIVVAAVEQIWSDATLQSFWKWGRLLPNVVTPEGTNGPYNSLVGEEQSAPPLARTAPRWFRLDAVSYGPKGEFSDANRMYHDFQPEDRRPIWVRDRATHYNNPADIWSLALETGVAPNRQWLVFVQSVPAPHYVPNDNNSAKIPDTLPEEIPNVLLAVRDSVKAKGTIRFASISAPRKGRYYHYTESDGTAVLGSVIDIASPDER